MVSVPLVSIVTSALRYSGSRPSRMRFRSVHGFAVIGHRPHVALRHHALHVILRRGAQPHGEAHGQQPLEGRRLGDQAAASGQHKARIAFDDIVEAAPLEAAKSALPVEIEDGAQR